MEGGIRAWKGVKAEGYPEPKMAYFTPATKPEEFIALAWYLEHGSQEFYSEIVGTLEDEAAKKLFRELVVAEGHHQTSLKGLYEQLSGTAADPAFPSSVIQASQAGEVMEGGISVDEALQWTKGKKVNDVLELSITLEANSYDLYVLMEGKMEDSRARKVFTVLSDEEKNHLNKLSALFEKRL